MLPQENFVNKALLRRVLVSVSHLHYQFSEKFVTIENPDSGHKIEPHPHIISELRAHSGFSGIARST